VGSKRFNVRHSKTLSVFCTSLLLLGGCSSHDASTSATNNPPVWPTEYSQAWLAEVQAQVPFVIVTPSYIPAGANLSPSIIEDPPPGKSSKIVDLSYLGPSGFSFVVSEANENYQFPTIPSGFDYFELNGVQILEGQVGSSWTYRWNYKNMFFFIQNNGYSRNEVLKVIGSLFY
jgi:hypothetical protein